MLRTGASGLAFATRCLLSIGAMGPLLMQPAWGQSARDATAAVRGVLRNGRVENWLVFTRSTEEGTTWQYWPRFYIPVDLSGGWRFTQRIDLPVAYTNEPGPQNSAGNWTLGLNDWFIEEIFSTPKVVGNAALLVTMRVVFPTGGLGPFGTGQYEVAPAIGVNYSTRGHSVTISPLARYFIGFAPSDPQVATVRTLDLFPMVTVALGSGWSLSLYSENPIAYDAVTGKWFIPFDALLLKRLDRNLDITVGGAYGFVRDDPQYLYLINASLALHF